MEGTENRYNEMQVLKRRMFAMRNGVIADALRKGGSKFSIIFGVNLPQLQEIANEMPHTAEFARKVWENTTTRESMLIAPMLMPIDDVDMAEALRWVSEVPEAEVADVLCLKLLRKLPFALDLARQLIASSDEMAHYTGLRLMCNLAPQHPDEAAVIGRKELEAATPLTRQAASVLASYGE